jgi:ribosomal protein S18 acetylase RimI-like enzyme
MQTIHTPSFTETKRQILDLIEDTFVDDEFWCTVLPNTLLRQDVAPCLFYIRFHYDITHSYVLMQQDEPRIIGHVVIKPPMEASDAIPWTMVWSSGMIGKIISWGYKSTVGRILTCKHELEQEMKKSKVIGDLSKAWTIEQVAVHSAYRGKGYGRILMEQCLHSVVPKGQRVVLFTQNKINVSFYEKVGFTIAEHRIVQFLGETRDNWCMHAYT